MKKKKRAQHRLERQRRERNKTILYWLIVAAVIVAAGYLLKPVFFRATKPPLAGKVIDIAADMSGFSMREIRMKAGESVSIRLESLDNQYHTDGGGKHQFAVDELGIDIIAQPLKTEYATFTPEQPGTYTFYCDICCGGRANPTMSGTLIVES